MNKKIAFVLLLLFAQITNAQSEYFSVLTCAPSPEVYARFGHTAIRYVNEAKNLDLVYNYGLFSYSEDFAYNFAKGETYYFLGVESFRRFAFSYILENRPIYEQKLNLSQTQVDSLKSLLQENALPENRKYLYDFFFNNCSTRPRDLIEQVLGKSLNWNYDKALSLPNNYWYPELMEPFINQKEKSGREAINLLSSTNSWLNFGINLGLGLPNDYNISGFNSMFLPDFLMLNIKNATIEENGNCRPLTNETKLITDCKFTSETFPLATSSIFVMWMLAIIFISIAVLEFYKKKHFYWIDSTLYFIIGLLGFFVWYICFVSIHPNVFPNMNTIWASPFHILFAVVWLIPSLRKWTKYYIYIYSMIFILYIISAFVNPQWIHPAYYPLLLVLASRFPIK